MTVVPAFGGCLWPVDTACFTTEWETYSPEVQARARALASSTLGRLTGNRVGNCPVKVRPCKAGCTPGYMPYMSAYGRTAFQPQINLYGDWVNACGCTPECSCVELCEVHLPAPVGRIDQVKVDGAVVAPANYRVDNGRTLVWTGAGECLWPVCQDMSKPDTEPGTFSVTYLNAHPVDSLGAYAAGVLAMEFGSACSGNSCRLPSGVTSIVRQGISMEIATGAFPNGLTGLREVDTFIALWNPDGLKRQSTVWSPDQRRARLVTGGIG